MDNGYTTIGLRDGWGGHSPFGLSLADRRRHMYALGQTGVGKSTLIFNMAVQDICAGRGIAFIDPHGDCAQALPDFVPPWRINDVVIFDPADTEYPIGLNLIRARSKDERHLVASSVVSAFKSIWHDSWGPRLEYILSMAVSALLECENVSLLGLPRMLVDAEYREWVVRQVKDPIVRTFWTHEFAQYNERFMQEAKHDGCKVENRREKTNYDEEFFHNQLPKDSEKLTAAFYAGARALATKKEPHGAVPLEMTCRGLRPRG